MRELWPVLANFDNNWLSAEMSRQFMSNRRKYQIWKDNGGLERKKERACRKRAGRQ
jgi:hypothetical protein